MAEALLFDPTSEGTGTELDVMSAPYAVTSMSFPAPGLETQTVGGIDTEGDSIAARRHQNRTISLTVEVTGTSQANLDASVATLEAKVAKAALQGGTLRRVRADGSFRTLDLLAADSYEKSFDIIYFTGLVAVCQVSLVAKPYARGAEVALTGHSEATLPVLTFTDTIGGDVPATGRLVITEGQAQNQSAVFWGVESTYYDATTTLFKQAESATLVTGSSVADGTASGGNVVRQSGAQTDTISFRFANLTNRGAFRVLARAKASDAVSQLKMSWQFAGTATGAQQTVTTGTTWAVYDLGVVRVNDPLVSRWTLNVHGTIAAAQTVSVDWVLLVPILDGAGVTTGWDPAIGGPGWALDASGALTIRRDTVIKGTSTLSFPPVYQGDYLRIPPGTARFVVKAARSTAAQQPDSPYVDNGIDDISATLYVTPRYLTVA